VKNHPFVDGNKRIGTMAADVFLRVNGLELVLTEEEFADAVLAVATSTMSKESLIVLLRQSTRPRIGIGP
jgi:death-on-curing protein